MADILLHTDKANSATHVSNIFIDNYMTAANGEYVKIYLYLLRCMTSPDCSFSISGAADKFEHTEKDIQRALKYWEKMKLLRLEYDSDKRLSGIYFLDSASQGEPFLMDAPAQQPHVPQKQKKRSYTADEIAAFQDQENVKELLFVTEHYLKRPLTPTDINTILSWYDELHFSVELIEYLIEYCIGKGHTSMHYMKKVAIGWKESGISTVGQAKQESAAYSQIYFSIMRALGIRGRNLISSEVNLINKWTKKYCFTLDIITEACRRTISSTHQPSFEYTDKILDSWNKEQVKHLSDIAKLDSSYQNTKTAEALQARGTAPGALQNKSPNKFNSFPQRSYDYDELEQQLLGQHST